VRAGRGRWAGRRTAGVRPERTVVQVLRPETPSRTLRRVGPSGLRSLVGEEPSAIVPWYTEINQVTLTVVFRDKSLAAARSHAGVPVT
jgi:hypothetical protein